MADIKEIKWSSAPFDGLALPDEQRETVMALTDTKPDAEFDDIVKGKGLGILILLQYGISILVLAYTNVRL